MTRTLFFNKKLRRKAFSIVEASIILLIIGSIIAALVSSSILIKKFRIITAQNLSLSSPINSIPDSVLWLESSLDKSFKDSESTDKSTLSTWYDIRETSNKNNATQENKNNAPTYSNTINYIHAVEFDGNNSYFTADGTILNNTNYTIFILEKRKSNKSDNYFIGDYTSNESSNLLLGYSANDTVMHAHSSENSYSSSTQTYESSNEKPRVFTFIHSNTSGKQTYINGNLSGESSDTTNLTNMKQLKIGSSYKGEIGEIVIFSRALSQTERESVESYLGNKWNVEISKSNQSCIDGIVTSDGCLLNCSVPTTSGINQSKVSSGSGVLTCDSSKGFSGSIQYNCANGTFNFTDKTECSCEGTVLNGYCKLNCTVPTTIGITTTSVSEGSGSLTCNNAANFSGTLSYNCSNGNFSYTGSSSCSCSGTIVNGECKNNCTVTTALGITTTTVSHGSGSLNCDTTNNFTGSLDYTCSNGSFAYNGNSNCDCKDNYRIKNNNCIRKNPVCSGGSTSLVTINGTKYKLHKFTSTGNSTLTCTVGGVASVLVVAGGGGGGQGYQARGGGGGGGGGVVYQSDYELSATSYTATVGAGGSPPNTPTNGGNSTFGTITAIGGGAGGSYNSGRSGGSGGGGAGVSGKTVATGTSGQGNNGGINQTTSGTNVNNHCEFPSAGGGGAGGVGGNSNNTTIGAGGVGLQVNIAGDNAYYGGGGSGDVMNAIMNCSTLTAPAGSLGGGGSRANKNGQANTGGGASGSYYGGTGGSGIIIIRYGIDD